MIKIFQANKKEKFRKASENWMTKKILLMFSELWEVMKVIDSKLEAFNSHILKKIGKGFLLQKKKKHQGIWKGILQLGPDWLAIKNERAIEHVRKHSILYALGMPE